MPQYEIIRDDVLGDTIKCLKCNKVSHHPMDVKYRWCGHCNVCLDPAMANEVAALRAKIRRG